MFVANVATLHPVQDALINILGMNVRNPVQLAFEEWNGIDPTNSDMSGVDAQLDVCAINHMEQLLDFMSCLDVPAGVRMDRHREPMGLSDRFNIEQGGSNLGPLPRAPAAIRVLVNPRNDLHALRAEEVANDEERRVQGMQPAASGPQGPRNRAGKWPSQGNVHPDGHRIQP